MSSAKLGRMQWWIGCLAAVGACTAGPATDCESAMGHASAIMAADPAWKTMPPASLDRAMAVSRERCVADRWSERVRRCFREAKNTAELQPCAQQLTPAQSTKLAEEMSSAMQAIAPSLDAAPLIDPLAPAEAPPPEEQLSAAAQAYLGNASDVDALRACLHVLPAAQRERVVR